MYCPHCNEPVSKKYVFTAAQNTAPPHKKFLRALENYCEHNNAQLVLVPKNKRPKIMTPAGAVPVESGEFHHSLGAIVVEGAGGSFFMRQLLALNNDSFIDIDKKYTADGVEDAPPAATLIMGDSYMPFIDAAVA